MGILCGLFPSRDTFGPDKTQRSLQLLFNFKQRAGERNQFSTPLRHSPPAAVSLSTTAQSPNEGEFLCGLRGKRATMAGGRRGVKHDGEARCIHTDLRVWGERGRVIEGGRGGFSLQRVSWNRTADTSGLSLASLQWQSREAILQSRLTTPGWTTAGWSLWGTKGAAFGGKLAWCNDRQSRLYNHIQWPFTHEAHNAWKALLVEKDQRHFLKKNTLPLFTL